MGAQAAAAAAAGDGAAAATRSARVSGDGSSSSGGGPGAEVAKAQLEARAAADRAAAAEGVALDLRAQCEAMARTVDKLVEANDDLTARLNRQTGEIGTLRTALAAAGEYVAAADRDALAAEDAAIAAGVDVVPLRSPSRQVSGGSAQMERRMSDVLHATVATLSSPTGGVGPTTGPSLGPTLSSGSSEAAGPPGAAGGTVWELPGGVRLSEQQLQLLALTEELERVQRRNAALEARMQQQSQLAAQQQQGSVVGLSSPLSSGRSSAGGEVPGSAKPSSPPAPSPAAAAAQATQQQGKPAGERTRKRTYSFWVGCHPPTAVLFRGCAGGRGEEPVAGNAPAYQEPGTCFSHPCLLAARLNLSCWPALTLACWGPLPRCAGMGGWRRHRRCRL